MLNSRELHVGLVNIGVILKSPIVCTFRLYRLVGQEIIAAAYVKAWLNAGADFEINSEKKKSLQ